MAVVLVDAQLATQSRHRERDRADQERNRAAEERERAARSDRDQARALRAGALVQLEPSVLHRRFFALVAAELAALAERRRPAPPRARGSSHRSGSGEQGLLTRAHQQEPPAAVDPACRQRQRHACGHAGKPAGGAGCAQILIQATGVERKPLLRISIQVCEVPARLPESAIREQGGGLPMGGVICGLVQQQAPPQRDQIRNSCAAAKWPSRGDLPPLRCRLRTGTSASSTTVVRIYTLLASTRGGLDQSTTPGNRTPTSCI